MTRQDVPNISPEDTVRVLHFITDLSVGGAERMLTNLVCTSNNQGIRHIVVSLMDGGTFAEQVTAAGIELHSLNINRGSISPLALFKSIALVRNIRPHVVQTWLYHADFLGLVAAMLGGTATVVWNLRCSDMDLSRYGRLTRILVRVLAKLSHLPSAIIANSEAGRRWHEGLGYHPDRWVVIGNGVNADRFRPDANARQRWREVLGVCNDDVVIGMVARLDPMKDHEGFLRAARAVAQPRRVFVLAGRGVDQSPSLQQLANATGMRVHFLPECDDVPGLMAALDIAVSASRFGEGFPNVLIEAMATGISCIATDVGDSARILGEAGVVVPQQDEPALSNAIARLASDPMERSRLGTAAQRRVAELFALDLVVQRYDEFYLNLATDR